MPWKIEKDGKQIEVSDLIISSFKKLKPPSDSSFDTAQEIKLLKNGASAVILANGERSDFPTVKGAEQAALVENSDFKIFGKPNTLVY